MSTNPSSTRKHERKLVIHAGPEKVWKAITDPEELVRWFPMQAEVTPGENGRISYIWGKDIRGDCSIRVWNPPHHLQTGWMEQTVEHSGGGIDLPSDPEARRRLCVDWYLEGKGGSTVLRVVHSGFGEGTEWDQEFDGTNRGWNFELKGLKHYIELHAGKTRRAVWVRQRVTRPAAEVWEKMTTTAGLLKEGTFQGLGAGDDCDATLITGDRIAGKVMMNAPGWEFSCTVRGLNDATFRCGYETCMGGPEAMLWLNTWDLPEAKVKDIETRWQKALAEMFA